MKAKLPTYLLLFVLTTNLFSQTYNWESHGIGGGGAFYRPSINPNNPNEYYVQTDMGVIFHTLNYGKSYDQLNQRKIGSALALTGVLFTNNNNIRYKIGDDNSGYPAFPYPLKSTDAGATWSRLSGFSILQPIYVLPTYLSVDFNNPNRVIIAVAGKIAISLDGGNSFTTFFTDLTGGNNLYWGENYVGGVFFDGNNIYAGGRFGLLISNDGGLSWARGTLAGMDPSNRILSLVGAKQGGVTRLFALAVDTAGGVKSGQCWTHDFGCLDNYNYGTKANVISAFGKIYSTDIGTNVWTAKMNGINPLTYNSGTFGFDCSSGTCDVFQQIAMAENDINTVYLNSLKYDGTFGILKTTDGGNSWSQVTQTAYNANIAAAWMGAGGDYGWGYAGICDIGVCATDPNRVIITDLFTVHTSDDGGATWKAAYNDPADSHPIGTPTQPKKFYKGSGLEDTGLWWLHWSSPQNILAGYTDISAIRSDDGGTKWSFDVGGPIRNMNTTYHVVKHNVQPLLFAATALKHNVYTEIPSDANVDKMQTKQSWIMYSSDSGANWNYMKNFSATVYWLATDPTNNNRLYASVANHADGVGGIYVTDDIQNLGSATWTKLSAPPRTEGHPACIRVLNDGLVLCTYSGRSADTATIWNMTNSSGVFLYNPGTLTWSDLSDPNMVWTSDIVLDPSDPAQNTWYVATVGASFYNYTNNPLNCWKKGGVYKTTNRGTSWARITETTSDPYGLDSIRAVNSLTFNPLNPKQVFVATLYDGLWACDDVSSATPFFYRIQNFPYLSLARIFFNPYKLTEMWVATAGNGMWVADLSPTAVHESSKAITEFNIYPIPANDKFNLVINDFDKGHFYPVIITDAIGRTISSFKAAQDRIQVDISNLNSGVYFVRVNDRVKKMIVQ